jgi:hypothetical protein
VIFDLSDNPVTTPETDRRRGRFTVVVVVVLLVVLGGLFLGAVAWMRDGLDQTETRQQGEKVLAAIAWQEEWRAEPAAFHLALPFVTDGKPHWTQQIITSVPDLSTADSITRDTLTAAGWVTQAECGSAATKTDCHWKTEGYALYAVVETWPGGTACPREPASTCAKVSLTLTTARPERT